MIPLLVIRHGATDWNRDELIQGRADRLLAPATRERLRATRLPPGWAEARCLASPLVRAMETAQLLGLDPAPEPRLIEMAWGDWEGKRLAEIRGELGPAMAENEARGLDFRPPGGESPREVQDRLKPLLQEIDRPTIFVTHKGVLRALYALAAGWAMKDDPPDKLRDGHAHEFKVAADGTVSIARLNIPIEAET
jgi:probable phosphoglycerate mutase